MWLIKTLTKPCNARCVDLDAEAELTLPPIRGQLAWGCLDDEGELAHELHAALEDQFDSDQRH